MQYMIAFEVEDSMTPMEVGAILIEVAKIAAQDLQENGHLPVVGVEYHIGKHQVLIRLE